ncbi:MAG: hypothetical protein ABI870_14945 [Rhodanobacter sp.]
MTSYYRFRPIDRLLGDSQELETQTVFFSEPDALNDPMEGLSELVFSGDAIVWENLFRHFLGCLAWGVIHHLFIKEEEVLTVRGLPLADPFHSPDIPFIRQVIALADRLVAASDMQSLVSHLANRKVPVTESELRFYLSRLHLPWAVEALRLIPEGVLKDGVPDAASLDVLNLLHVVETTLAATGNDTDDSAEKLRAAFEAANATHDQMALRAWLCIEGPARENHRFVYVSFVARYLEGLRTLVYPDWYMACFMDSISNASVWGHYANGHRDVCLKFRATANHETDFLPLRVPAAANGAGPIWNEVPIPFKAVVYSPSIVRLNFFTSMGSIPIPTLNKVWRVNRKRELSPIEREVHADETRWRAKHWEDFETSITTKLEDWSYEREHRLTFWSHINDLSSPQMRLMTYNFEDLEGIVFGIKTSESSKREIIRIIRRKCAKAGRKDFEFLQAYRNPDGAGIETYPLDLLSHIED